MRTPVKFNALRNLTVDSPFDLERSKSSGTMLKRRQIIISSRTSTILRDKTLEDPLLKERNSSCEKIQDSEFPEDIFTKRQRKFGAIILHVILFSYAFGAIAIVCEDYFLPTIKCICDDLKLSDDVAAATFMSIATSSPELFTNIIGTFITESDIGLGHVIGNGYYDMFFVASLGGLFASKDIVLEWWPLARDSSFYFLVALTLTGIVWDGKVQTHETIILLLLYAVYIFLMFNNNKLKELLAVKFNIRVDNEQIESNEPQPAVNIVSVATNEGRQEKCEIEEIEPLESEPSFTLPPQQLPAPPKKENKWWIVVKKIFTVPLRTMFRYTIPDVRIGWKRKYYPISFVLCIAWIGVSTYLGTWMISVIGETIGVPDLIMGMVFMAAGGSVVEAYAVYYKAKRGECSIGLSNSMGCNNLDGTLCLALPWFVKTLMPPGCNSKFSSIALESQYIHINCLLLVISVAVLFIIFYMNKFTLNKKLGAACGAVYAVVIIIAISIESYNENE